MDILYFKSRNLVISQFRIINIVLIFLKKMKTRLKALNPNPN
jgi:hypothetical protein